MIFWFHVALQAFKLIAVCVLSYFWLKWAGRYPPALLYRTTRSDGVALQFDSGAYYRRISGKWYRLGQVCTPPIAEWLDRCDVQVSQRLSELEGAS